VSLAVPADFVSSHPSLADEKNTPLAYEETRKPSRVISKRKRCVHPDVDAWSLHDTKVGLAKLQLWNQPQLRRKFTFWFRFRKTRQYFLALGQKPQIIEALTCGKARYELGALQTCRRKPGELVNARLDCEEIKKTAKVWTSGKC